MVKKHFISGDIQMFCFVSLAELGTHCSSSDEQLQNSDQPALGAHISLKVLSSAKMIKL